MTFIQDLTTTFQSQANPAFAKDMSAYMLNQFPFFGIKAPQRRQLMKPLVEKHHMEVRDTFRTIAMNLYDLPERELHMCAIELFEKQIRKSYKKEDINFIETLITTNSWWDSVDVIAKQILGKYLLKFPKETKSIIDSFSNSDNLWLNRSAIIFQLGYKDKTNKTILFSECLKHKDSDEFFIKKAIGWALREYGKVNPKAVLEFVNSNTLKPLSKREAIRKLI